MVDTRSGTCDTAKGGGSRGASGSVRLPKTLVLVLQCELKLLVGMPLDGGHQVRHLTHEGGGEGCKRMSKFAKDTCFGAAV
jgi:hypothetical protein